MTAHNFRKAENLIQNQPVTDSLRLVDILLSFSSTSFYIHFNLVKSYQTDIRGYSGHQLPHSSFEVQQAVCPLDI